MLRPTKRKLLRTLLLGGIFPLALLLRSFPPDWDVLDLAELAGAFLRLTLGGPIALFDAVTGRAFAPRGGGFLVLPSTPQLLFAVLANVVVLYTIACAWERASTGRARASEQPRG